MVRLGEKGSKFGRVWEGYLGGELVRVWLDDRSTRKRLSRVHGKQVVVGEYFEHMEERGFACIVEAEEEQLCVFVKEAK
jgi:hypothetical protein